MKLKKNIVITFFIIMFGLLSFIYLYNNKDVTYKNVISDNKEYNATYDSVNSSDFVYSNEPRCDKYNIALSSVNKIVQDENNNLWYVVQGCAWDPYDIARYDINSSGNVYQKITNDFQKQVCQAQRSIINIHSESDVNKFNQSECKNLGIDTLEYTELEVQCNNFSPIETGNYDKSKFVYGSSHICTTDDNPLKGKTGILGKNVTDASRPIYLIQGCSWALFDIAKNTSNSCITDTLKRTMCEYERDFLESDLDNNKHLISNYNSSCVDTGILDESNRLQKSEYINIVFKASYARGMECNDRTINSGGITYTIKTTNENECTYSFNKNLIGSNITISGSELPNTSSLKQLTSGYSFSGWKRGSELECNSGSISLVLPNNIDEITYNACFDGEETKSLGYTIYNSCKGNNIYEDNTTGTTTVDNTSVLTSTISATQEYITTNLSNTSVSHGNSFNLNKFCSIKCTETFDYSYPTIFETVKSGTYFELLSYPEIKSKLTCVETFDYNGWESTYKSAIKDEKEAYVNKKNSDTISEWSSLTNSGVVCDSECSEPCESGFGCCGDMIYYYDMTVSGTFNKYDRATDSISSETYTYTKCSNLSPTIDDAKSSARTNYGLDASTDYNEKYSSTKQERENTENANLGCVKAMSNSEVSTDNFYKLQNPNMYFYYESDVGINSYLLNGDSNRYYKEVLKATNVYTKDSNVHDWNSDSLNVGDEPFNISYLDVTDSFTAKKTENTFLRTVNRNYVYDHSEEHKVYYSKKHTGKILDESTKSVEDIYLGYVYPVKLTLNGSRNVYFAMKAGTNLSYGASQILNSEPDNVSDINVYKCSYDISNDVIVKEKDTDDYKKNFYVRSVSTSNVDPNDRMDNGTFGANWANDKGKTLINIIEEKSKGNNTYNPNNLEYSFTLNAQTIEAIRDYNDTNRYDDFNLDCNNLGGECKSKFLTELAGENVSGINRVGSIEVSNVNPIINRESWKYYINGKWMKTTSITNTGNWVNLLSGEVNTTSNVFGCLKTNGYGNKLAKETYDCIYRDINEGVLP